MSACTRFMCLYFSYSPAQLGSDLSLLVQQTDWTLSVNKSTYLYTCKTSLLFSCHIPPTDQSMMHIHVHVYTYYYIFCVIIIYTYVHVYCTCIQVQVWYSCEGILLFIYLFILLVIDVAFMHVWSMFCMYNAKWK